jgi:flagellar L-ring protein precursor FlgH
MPREPLVQQPMTARADTYAAARRGRPGAIFREGPGANALFEDRARATWATS